MQVKFYKTSEGPFLPYRMGITVNKVNKHHRVGLFPEVDSHSVEVKYYTRGNITDYVQTYRDRFSNLNIVFL